VVCGVGFCALIILLLSCFFFQAEDGIRDRNVTGVQTCALPIFVFHMLPVCNVVTPITTWQERTPFSWMYWFSVRRLLVSWSPSSRTVPVPGSVSTVG